MKLANRVLAMLLAFALVLGFSGTEVLAAEWGNYLPEENWTETGVAEHVHNEGGWKCTKADDERVLICTLDEHTHDADCYAAVDPEAAPELICTQEEVEGHKHVETCYEETVDYTCGLEETEGHEHMDECYGEPTLICELPETEGHTHTDECNTTESTLTCEIPENHVHTVDCYILDENMGMEMEIDGQTYLVGPMICEIEENHEHSDACYEETTTQNCGLDESEGHTHSDECYGEPELICELPETEGHTHTDECKHVEKVLICEEEETEGHTHTDECYAKIEVPVLLCKEEETIGHTHSDSCYIEKLVLVCELEETGDIVHVENNVVDMEAPPVEEGHKHNSKCYELQRIPVCGLDEKPAHMHTEACYLNGLMPELICEDEVHVHSNECYAVIKGEWTCVEPAPEPEEWEKPQGDIAMIAGNAILLGDPNRTVTVQNSGTITLTGEWQGNIIVNGGANVTIQGSGTINAAGRNASAIRIKGGATVVINGDVTIKGGIGTDMTSPEMEPRDDHTFKVGGGVYVENGTLKLMNGTITENTAQRGGGIFINSGANLTMTGGTVTSNKTVDKNSDEFTGGGSNLAGEGGGIFVLGKATISGGYITNNACQSSTDLGGGGLYVNNNGIATLINVKVTGNTADGFGGGIAGCCHGEMSLVATDGVALYENTARATRMTTDKVGANAAEVIDEHTKASNDGFDGINTSDYYTAGSSIISNYMSGGGSARYSAKYGDQAAVQLDDNQVVKKEKTRVGLVANPTEESKDKVPAGVTISRNTSTVHGGGIGCNGGLYFGSAGNTTVETNVLNLELTARKILKSGKKPAANQFTFELVTKDDALIATAKNDEDGNIKFSISQFADIADEIGSNNELTLYLKEKTGTDPNPNMQYDKSIYQIDLTLNKKSESQKVELGHTTESNKFEKISVTYRNNIYSVDSMKIYKIQNGFGESIGQLVLEPGQVTFINNDITTINWQPIVKKTMDKHGNDIPAEHRKNFTFTLEQVPSIDNEANETIVLPETQHVYVSYPYNDNVQTFAGVTFSEPGVYHFMIKEEKPEEDITGYTYDPSVYNITVSVLDHGQGQLQKLVSVVESATSGRFTASAYYEKPIEDGYEFEFKNDYQPKPVQIDLVAHKTVVDEKKTGTVLTPTFTFSLEEETGSSSNGRFSSADVLQTKDLKWDAESDGIVNFDPIYLDKAGTYKYHIREVAGDAAGFTYDSTVYFVTVVVTDNNGTLEATVDYGNGAKCAEFTNRYNPGKASYQPKVTKTLVGQPIPTAKTFQFELSWNMNKNEKYSMDAHQTIEITQQPGETSKSAVFEELEYDRPGEYEYTIREVKPENAETEYHGFGFDDTVWNLKVVVVDDGGKLKVESATYTAGETKSTEKAAFENTYEVDATEVTLTVLKKVDTANKAKQLSADTDFTFKLEEVLGTDESGRFESCETIETVTLTIPANDPNKLQNTVSFAPVPLNRAGEYRFKITEVKGTATGFTYDDTTWYAIVMVEDHNGRLEVVSTQYVVKTNGQVETKNAVFVNKYNPEMTSFGSVRKYNGIIVAIEGPRWLLLCASPICTLKKARTIACNLLLDD